MNEETLELLRDLIAERKTEKDVEFIEVLTGKKSTYQKLSQFSVSDFIENTYHIKIKRPIIAPEIWAVLDDDIEAIRWNQNLTPIAISSIRSSVIPLDHLKGLYLNGCPWQESKVMRSTGK